MATLITGGTGFVGSYLLDRVPDPIVTSRNASRAKAALGASVTDVIEWDPIAGPIPLTGNEKIDGVINLMGESVAEGRWNDAKKKRIRDSRVLGTQNLVAGLRKLNCRPKSFVSASAVGIYGDQGDAIVDESNSGSEGFMADLCRDWESAAMDYATDGVPVTVVRIGIVLGRGGGAIDKLLPIFKWGLGGALGSGKQYVPWIHVSDLANMFKWLLETPSQQGVFNGSAPQPVTNSEQTKAIANAVRRPALLPVPEFAVKLALGGFAQCLFDSQRVVPKAALDAGFEFEYTTVQQAMAEIVGR